MQVNIKKKYQIKTKKTNVEHLKFHRILLFLVFMYNDKHRGLCVVASQIMYNWQLNPNGVKGMKDKKAKAPNFPKLQVQFVRKFILDGVRLGGLERSLYLESQSPTELSFFVFSYWGGGTGFIEAALSILVIVYFAKKPLFWWQYIYIFTATRAIKSPHLR